MLSAAFHFSVGCLYMYTIYYDNKYLDFPFPSDDFKEFPLKSRHAFMTMWCLILQTLYFVVALLNDVIGTKIPSPKKSPAIRIVRDYLFSLAFPMAAFVTLAFWSIYSYDRELILPEYVRDLFPWWVNHTMHTLVFVFITIEAVIFPRNYPARKTGSVMMMALSISYIVCLNTFYVKTQMYVYPFLNVIPFPMTVLLFALSPFVAVFFFVVCEKINGLIWSKAKCFVNGKSQ